MTQGREIGFDVSPLWLTDPGAVPGASTTDRRMVWVRTDEYWPPTAADNRPENIGGSPTPCAEFDRTLLDRWEAYYTSQLELDQGDADGIPVGYHQTNPQEAR